MSVDVDFWGAQPQYSADEAAYLFCELEPPARSRLSIIGPEMPGKVLSMMNRIQRGIQTEKGERKEWYSNTELKQFAKHERGLRPSFLFTKNEAADQRPSDELTDTERDNLLRTIGALALALVNQQRGSQLGSREKPNATQIENAALEAIVGKQGEPPAGMRGGSVRKRIAAALELLDS